MVDDGLDACVFAATVNRTLEPVHRTTRAIMVAQLLYAVPTVGAAHAAAVAAAVRVRETGGVLALELQRRNEPVEREVLFGRDGFGAPAPQHVLGARWTNDVRGLAHPVRRQRLRAARVTRDQTFDFRTHQIHVVRQTARRLETK